tara:strand:- start:692 stop:2587 length:1896 start_codon:yes stop_codon:yes gene_type:complete
MSLTLTPITLSATVDTFGNADLYGESDGLGLASQYLTFNMSLKNINPQNHSDSSTREPLQYNGLDIQAGMFIADTGGGTILRINSISDKSLGALTCVVEDVDMMSYRLNSVNSFAAEESVIVFGLNPEGEPVFAGSPFQVAALQKIISRFSLNERDDRVKFSHTLNTGLAKGDIAAVNASGNLVKYGTANSSDTKLGIVVDVYKGSKDVFIKPFNDIVRNYAHPEKLTGNPGQVYYTDGSNLGEVTTATGGKAVFMHLNSSIATTVEITSSTNPGATDVMTINGVTVFDGPNGDSVADTAAWAASLNTQTSSTNVSAAITQAPGELNAEGNSMAYPGTIAGQDMVIFTNIQGSAPTAGAFPSCTISDGNNTATVTFNNPDATVNYGTIYEYAGPNAILAAFNTAITNGGLDITASLYASPTHAGDAIQLTTTGSATGITLANTQADEFGINIVGSGAATGLSTSASLGASTLTLTRSSGGPIDIDGTPLNGGYINQSGVVSSNSGRVPFLLMIESEGGGGSVSETGVNVRTDYNQTASATSSDGDSTGATITYTPFSDGSVIVKVNGLQVNIGDGAKDQACYFSADGGTTARSVADIAANDTLYWMGSVANYELEADDEIDIVYAASSNDV